VTVHCHTFSRISASTTIPTLCLPVQRAHLHSCHAVPRSRAPHLPSLITPTPILPPTHLPQVSSPTPSHTTPTHIHLAASHLQTCHYAIVCLLCSMPSPHPQQQPSGNYYSYCHLLFFCLGCVCLHYIFVHAHYLGSWTIVVGHSASWRHGFSFWFRKTAFLFVWTPPGCGLLLWTTSPAGLPHTAGNWALRCLQHEHTSTRQARRAARGVTVVLVWDIARTTAPPHHRYACSAADAYVRSANTATSNHFSCRTAGTNAAR